MSNQVILTSTYFGPVQWYQKLVRHDRTLIERYDSFVKQTYRNRCVIATANGLQALTVPVERSTAAGNTSGNGLMKDMRISDHGNWRHLHWNALQSAYGESPFFEYYADDIRPFFERRWTFLYDFNLEICHKMCQLLDIQPYIQPTDHFTPICTEPPYIIYGDDGTPAATDYREAIRPKHPLHDSAFTPRSYYQVYARRHGFMPNLSILDLLFNMGNESILWLYPSK